MTYRLSMAVDAGTCLEIESPTFDELSQEWVSLGGDAEWLASTAKAAVTASEHGAPVATAVRSLGGEVISDEAVQRPVQEAPASKPVAEDPFASDVPELVADAAPSTPSAAPSDPWAEPEESADDEYASEKDWPGEASVARTALTGNKPPPVDPWAAPSASTPADVPPVNIRTTRDDWGREWTTGLPDAPECNCDPPEKAVHMHAKSKAGNKYSKWKCAKSASKSTFRGKCDLDEFVNK